MSLPLVPITGPETRSWLYVLARAINALIQGRSNAIGTFTLAVAPATTTTVTNNLFEPSMVPVFAPTTASAALATTAVYVSARADGSFTLTHDASASAGRTFIYTFHG